MALLVKDYLNRDKLAHESNREGFGRGLVAVGQTHPEVVVLSADLSDSTKVRDFKEQFPERFFEVGVAEQNMLGIAAGLALSGKIPFASSYAVFSPGRNWDQLRVSVCYSQANVKIVGSHAGLSVGADGATHQGLEDIALTRVLPNLVVLSPADSNQAEKAVLAALEHPGPVYLRLSRANTAVFYTADAPLVIGQAEVLKEGHEAVIFATGPLVYEALLAAEELQGKRSLAVVDVSSIKPLDEVTIISLAKRTGKVITVEEHQIAGGLGGAVAELLAEKLPVPVKRIGVEDRFGESGSVAQLWRKYGLDATSLVTKFDTLLS